MPKFLTFIAIVLLSTIKLNGQGLDSLELSEKEIPAGYSLTADNNCISVQACLFYENPEIYEALIGKLKNKKIQNFNSKKDKGAIMYFEFEDDFKGKGFLEGILWGADKPSKEHPEEFFAKGKFLIIWSFKKGSVITATSKNKIQTILE